LYQEKNMKKILLAMAAFAFCIVSAQAENGQQPTDIGIYINQSLANQVSVADILDQLIKNHVLLQDAVDAVLKAGADKQDTLAAALIINPSFTYNDPTLGLNPTASGTAGDTNSSKLASLSKTSGGGKHSTFALSGGGGASPF